MTTEKEFSFLIKKASQPLKSSKKKAASASAGRYTDSKTRQRKSVSSKGKRGGKSR